MSILGSNLAQSIAGASQAERVASHDIDKTKEQRPRMARVKKDEFERHVSEVETAEAVEALNDQERRDQDGDRHRRDPRNASAHGYDASGAGRHEHADPKIDLKG